MKLPGDNNNMRKGGLTMEDEMNLDGMIVSASFDEPLEMVRPSLSHEFTHSCLPFLLTWNLNKIFIYINLNKKNFYVNKKIVNSTLESIL